MGASMSEIRDTVDHEAHEVVLSDSNGYEPDLSWAAAANVEHVR
jgi:hypothetical protein